MAGMICKAHAKEIIGDFVNRFSLVQLGPACDCCIELLEFSHNLGEQTDIIVQLRLVFEETYAENTVRR